jgi:hypothetical protein
LALVGGGPVSVTVAVVVLPVLDVADALAFSVR